MDKDFWLNRWMNRQISFHKDHYNPHLVDYWDKVIHSKSGGVFVPLCGKSLDMLYFAQKNRPVVGVELSRQGIEEFFSDNKIEYQQLGNHYQSALVDLYCHDFFELTKDQLAGVNVIYDRASLIALPPDLRLRYTQKITSLFSTGTEYFLLANEYDNELVGPPFSVSDKMVQDYYQQDWNIEVFFEVEERPEDIDVHIGKVKRKINRGFYLKRK